MPLSTLLVWFVCHALPGIGWLLLAGAQTPTGGRGAQLWVLAVGVGQYAQPELRLRFAAGDARAVASALEKQAGGPLYEAVHTRVLVDEQVTRESILEGMVRFLGQARPNDVAVLFLAGHGVQDRSTGSYYFLPAPATPANYVSTGLRMTDLDEMLRLVRRSARGVVVMLDTCHAGALRVAAPQLQALDDPAARLNAGEGFFLLAASKPGEESEERSDLGHGAFTYGILRGLAGAADADHNGEITVTELFGYVTRTVAAITAERQHPYYKVEGTDFSFVAVRPGMASLPTPASVGHADRPASTGQAEANSVAVMTFQNLRSDPEHDWVGIALRTAFNTELSKVKALQVYAPELVDRALAQRGGDLLAVARQLGIERLITGSFSIVGGEIRIDAHIVYSRTGLQEGSDSVQGSLDDFFTLQKHLVYSLLRRMHVAAPSDTSGGEKTSLDALRLLLESEGEIEVPPERVPRPSPTRPRPARKTSWFDLWPPVSLVSLAWAEEPGSAEQEAVALIERYRQALVSKDVEAFARLYVDFPTQRRATLARYFENAVDLRVEIDDVRVDKQGEDVVVSFLRRDRFVDRESGKPITLEVRLTRRLVRTPRGWLIAGKP
ncbi:MAG: caspase family protein [Candidatus Binatia bacterium]|nr:caspase family protein [Candidatus Binatia bacterium]